MKHTTTLALITGLALTVASVGFAPAAHADHRDPRAYEQRIPWDGALLTPAQLQYRVAHERRETAQRIRELERAVHDLRARLDRSNHRVRVLETTLAEHRRVRHHLERENAQLRRENERLTARLYRSHGREYEARRHGHH